MTKDQQTQLDQLEETIRQAQQQIEELKNPKPKKFEWEYGNNPYRVSISQVHSSCGVYNDDTEHGRYRITKEVAEQSLARNKRANRLEALAEQLGGLNNKLDSESRYYIYLHSETNCWKYVATLDWEPEKVYMTKECAIEICRMLNSNEFSLEGKL